MKTEAPSRTACFLAALLLAIATPSVVADYPDLAVPTDAAVPAWSGLEDGPESYADLPDRS